MKFTGPLVGGRWRVGPRLGSGAQAETYVARDEQGDEGVVVLKRLTLGGGKTWKSFDLFEREARVLESLRHPRIPRYIASFEEPPGTFNLVMEKKPGATLRAIATKYRFDDDDLRDLLARLLEILDYLHAAKPPVIHRDIKPANLVRAADGSVALVDFGGVRAVLRTEGGSTVIGTFGYMAPEQLHGQATPATDIYALGATLVALAGGVEPEDVPRKGLRMDLDKHLRGSDPGLITVLKAMTEPDPEARPQTARDVMDLLRRQPLKRPLRAANVLAPPKRDALARRTNDDRAEIATAFDDAGDALAEIPRPLGTFVRLLVGIVSLGGFLGLTLLRAILLPLVFVLVSTIAGKSKGLSDARTQSYAALEEGASGFRELQRRCFGAPPRRELPPPRES